MTAKSLPGLGEKDLASLGLLGCPDTAFMVDWGLPAATAAERGAVRAPASSALSLGSRNCERREATADPGVWLRLPLRWLWEKGNWDVYSDTRCYCNLERSVMESVPFLPLCARCARPFSGPGTFGGPNVIPASPPSR